METITLANLTHTPNSFVVTTPNQSFAVRGERDVNQNIMLTGGIKGGFALISRQEWHQAVSNAQ